MTLYNKFGHGATYLVLTFVYLAALCIVYTVEVDSVKLALSKEKTTSPSSYYGTLFEAAAVPGTVWMLVYTVLYKCGRKVTMVIDSLWSIVFV